jgi:hypothetical protein
VWCSGSSSCPPSAVERYDHPGAERACSHRANAATSRTRGLTWGGGLLRRHEAVAAALLNNGRVLVVAGADDRIPRGAAEAFDPAIGTNGSWTQACCVGPRILHTATLLADGRVLVAGGWDGNDSLATTPLFDPAAGTWSFIDPLTQARDAHTATLLSDGRVLVAGGEVARGGVLSRPCPASRSVQRPADARTHRPHDRPPCGRSCAPPETLTTRSDRQRLAAGCAPVRLAGSVLLGRASRRARPPLPDGTDGQRLSRAITAGKLPWSRDPQPLRAPLGPAGARSASGRRCQLGRWELLNNSRTIA